MTILALRLLAGARRFARITVVAPLFGLGACGGYAPNYDLLARGPTAEFSAVSLQAAAQNQERVVTQLSIMAGLKGVEPVGSTQWAQFGAAAMGRARIECNAYITEIMKVEEHRRTINQQLSLAAAGTAGILGVTGAAGAAIAITAIAFGLAQGTVDNVTTGLLYSLGAEPVEALVERLRAAYADKLTADSWKDRPTTFNTIYGYLELCTPVVLREKIKTAISTVQANATTVDSRGFPPQVTLATQRIVADQEVKDTKSNLPPPPLRPVDAIGAGPTEKVSAEYVRQLQVALCVTPVDGNLGALPQTLKPSNTRTAMRQYLSGKSGGAANPQELDDTLDRGASLTKFDEAIDRAFLRGKLATCADRGGYLSNGYEVGRWAQFPVPDRASEFKRLLTKIRRELGSTDAMPNDANLEVTTRNAIVDLRKKWQLAPDTPNAEKGFDFTITKRIEVLPDQ